MTKTKTPDSKVVVSLKHEKARRKNIPTAELAPIAQRSEEDNPVHPISFQRNEKLGHGAQRARDPDLDPQVVWDGLDLILTPSQIDRIKAGEQRVSLTSSQLVWRGKDQQDWSDLVVQSPALYIQEKIHPKAIIEDLLRHTKSQHSPGPSIPDLFDDFNGIDPKCGAEFYQHDQNWQNRMILGDSLQVMASLAEREGLRNQIQCIYFDPPYGISFNSNWQVSTRSRQVSDGQIDQITREPEQVKAFRDTWKDGVHSYLTYIRDRLLVMRDLLRENGSIFVQIGEENVHRVRCLMDEIYGEENFVSEILIKKKGSQISKTLSPVNDYILFYCRDHTKLKFRKLYTVRTDNDTCKDFPYAELGNGMRVSLSVLERQDSVDYRNNYPLFIQNYPDAKLFNPDQLTCGGFRTNQSHDFVFRGKTFPNKDNLCWKHTAVSVDGKTPGMERLAMADRIFPRKTTLNFVRYAPNPPVKTISNWWDGLGGAKSPIYVVQSNTEIIQRCILMTTDPGDLVFDPTCGAGTTAYVSEQWGRRWITVDTSRVALALARARLMGAVYPYYILLDSYEGSEYEASISGKSFSESSFTNDIRHGFVYERVHLTTSGSIANNEQIDEIWESYRQDIDQLHVQLNAAVNEEWKEWEIPLEASPNWSEAAKSLHSSWWSKRLSRQTEIDQSISRRSITHYLYDRPYVDKKRVRVSGPFTVESSSPHRMLPADESDSLAPSRHVNSSQHQSSFQDFVSVILENLRTAGIQQAAKENHIIFDTLNGWPGNYISAVGHFTDGTAGKRAAIFVGPEFGTISRSDLTAAAREAFDARFDILIACGFNFDAHTTDYDKLGHLSILKVKMNLDLHMSDELKNTGDGNTFVIFGEPDITWKFNDRDEIIVQVHGIDVFDPISGEIRASDKDDIAAWFIDTNYNEESFFVRHAYFLGAQDPYSSLKKTLKIEIDQLAWDALYNDHSRPFSRPSTGRFAVKVINHFGDEVMKVFVL